MIPDIGLIIGMYVTLRCMSFLTRRHERREGKMVKFLALVTMPVTWVCMLDMLAKGL